MLNNFLLKLDEELQKIPAADTAEKEWSQLKQATHNATAETVGFRRRVHRRAGKNLGFLEKVFRFLRFF